MAANMIGSGVFLTAGFSAQTIGPGEILLSWVVGGLLALTGAYAYAEVARLIPRSGGEYRYLTEFLHPSLGAVAGWASLFFGFSAPIAVNALGAAAFMATMVPIERPRAYAAGLVILITLFHTLNLRSSKTAQNVLVIIKVVLLGGFIAVGLFLGDHAWPTWTPPSTPADATTLSLFVGTLFWVAFAFSGWNAAIYAAEEFENPKRDVPRAMLIGCSLVAVAYLVVNWVFVANLTPDQAIIVADESQKATLAHAVIYDLVGPEGGSLMSGFTVIAFVSAMSAMIMVGPRVYAAMAKDGVLPRILAGKEGRPPTGSLLLQCGIALTILFAYDLAEVLANVGALLVLFTALTLVGLFAQRFRPRAGVGQPSIRSLIAAGAYAIFSAWMLYFGFQLNSSLGWWLLATCGIAALFHLIGRLGHWQRQAD